MVELGACDIPSAARVNPGKDLLEKGVCQVDAGVSGNGL